MRELKLFRPKKEGDKYVMGWVSHTSTGTLGDFFISVAPLFFGSFASVMVFSFLVLGMNPFLLSTRGGNSPFSLFLSVLMSVGGLWRRVLDWRFYFGLYLLFCLSLTSSPSDEDLEGWERGLFFSFSS